MLRLHNRALGNLQSRYVCSTCLVRTLDQRTAWHSQSQGFALSHRVYSTENSNAVDETESTPAAAAPNPRKPRARRRRKEKPTPTPTPTPASTTETSQEGGASPEIVHQLFSSLKKLEQSYASINKKLANLQESGPNAQSLGSPQSGSETPGNEPTDLFKLQTRKLGSRLKIVSGTLDVLKSVLESQHIPIEGLRKRSNQEKETSPPVVAQADKPADSQARAAETPKAEATKPKKPAKRTKLGLTSRSDAAKDSATPAFHPPAEQTADASVTTLAGRLRQNLQPAVSSAISSGLASSVAPAASAKPATKTQTQTQTQTQKPGPKSSKRHKAPLSVQVVRANKLEMVPVERPGGPEAPALAHGLDRVLFNPGVYHLQDPRSRVYNFDPYLSRIMPLSEFDFSALKQYVTSSKDSTLLELASKLGKKYSGSTSSMTAMLSHFHYLLSAWRPVNPKDLSRNLEPDYTSFTQILRAPAATFLHHRDGVYAIDADKEFDSANILSMLGKSMEKLLTLPKEEFERYRHQNSDQITEEERNAEEAFHFSTLGDFLMRSQLDAYDKRLPGTGMFDLKTRAVVSIRMDARGFHKGLGYEIRRRFGQWESFEREYYDMMRAAFLKYSLQVRMGRMDGIFVAFHNTQRIFGFQYIPLEEMDNAIHGVNDRNLGDQEFKLSLHLLNKVFDRATERFPGRTLRIHVETRPGDPPFMYIFAKPVVPKEVEQVQNANQAAVAEFERQLLGLEQAEAEATETPDLEGEQSLGLDEEEVTLTTEAKRRTVAFWEEMQDKVEEAVEDDALGVSHVRDAIQDALEQSGLLKARSPEEAQNYVQALLDALTGGDASENAASAPKTEEEPSTSPEAAAVDTSQAETPATSEPTSSETAGDSLSPSPESSSSRSSDRSLKELILRVAERVDEKADSDGPIQQVSDDVASDTSKLREFERILSQLVETSRVSGTETSSASARPDEGNVPQPTSSPTTHASTASETAKPTDKSDTNAPEGAASSAEESSATPEEPEEPEDEILGMHLMVRNKVNGEYVDRPDGTVPNLRWTVEYSLEEIPTKKARKIYKAIQDRRKKALQSDSIEQDRQWYHMWKGKLAQLSARGRRFRERQEAKGRKEPVHVMDVQEPLTWEEAFAHHEQWGTKKE
ncbi:Pet127-domain-containing protein [Sodiomyces alkalinus F11]|uniref:Pet127-domain-containing protein n=1 Tax=Sodiomyces alkalinus (strain CBS 110278 / VKM F-3762 / F11) TaxID=1314773 RepID=A0A3N2PXG7_SODAK|nr:Pet127-domain-containing protein [Sodiomyces alkalinus F11]ROT39187.1 Pet127-domain-containing protein [Sodiomyces alkalinus F11]